MTELHKLQIDLDEPGLALMSSTHEVQKVRNDPCTDAAEEELNEIGFGFY